MALRRKLYHPHTSIRVLLFFFLLLTNLTQNVSSSKIAIIPMFGKSHVHTMNLLAEVLMERGHEVMTLSNTISNLLNLHPITVTRYISISLGCTFGYY